MLQQLHFNLQIIADLLLEITPLNSTITESLFSSVFVMNKKDCNLKNIFVSILKHSKDKVTKISETSTDYLISVICGNLFFFFFFFLEQVVFVKNFSYTG